MTEGKQLTLRDDLPKRNPWQEDRLGYAPFAKRLARLIINLRAPNGYVIGLHGKWGSGKSTTLNFVKAFIDKHNAESEEEGKKIRVIDFQPWIVSGHQDLIAAFFKILSENLGPRDGWWKRHCKRVARLVSGTTDNLVDAAATVALTIDPSGGIASRFAGTLAKKSVNSVLGHFLEDPSLQKAYENLRDQLERSGKRFLITIDDLDRLETSEAKTILQLVKTVGRLPNLVYILAYDREIVWGALDEGRDSASPRFAEKIVQQEIELPKPSKSALLSILDQELSFVTGSTDDSMRWYYIVRDGISRWIRLPRDALRLSNAVKFSWPALIGEIDPQDLIAMEGLRLFDEQAFYWVHANRDFLFAQGRFLYSQDEMRVRTADSLRGRLPDDTRDQILHILAVLFPSVGKWVKGSSSFTEESHIEVQRRRGVGSEAGYDAYFSLHPSLDEVPKSTIDAMMSNLSDSPALVNVMTTYLGAVNSRGQPMIGKVLEELRYRFGGQDSAPPTQALLDALFEVGEAVISIRGSSDLFASSPRVKIGFLIDDLLGAWGSEHAGTHLIDAFSKSTSPSFCADIFVDRGRELGVFPSKSSERSLISMGEFDELGKRLLPLIKKAAADGTLEDAPYYVNIVRSWSHLEGNILPKAWLSNGMQRSGQFLIKVARGLINEVTSSSGQRYEMREALDEGLYDLKLFLVSAQNHLSNDVLDDDQRKLLIELERGTKQLLASGKSGSE